MTDLARSPLGRIVHGADIPADLAITPQAAGLRASAHGFAATCADYHRKLAPEFPVYDALYGWCQAAAKGDRV